jgi:hypothetical protein
MMSIGICGLFILLVAVWISLFIFPIHFFTLLFHGLDNVHVCHAGNPVCSYHSAVILQHSLFSELLIAHTMLRICDLLISLLGRPYRPSSYRTGRSVLNDQTSVTGFMEGHPLYMPYRASNTVIFYPVILLCCFLHQRMFWDRQPDSAISWTQSLVMSG